MGFKRKAFVCFNVQRGAVGNKAGESGLDAGHGTLQVLDPVWSLFGIQ